MRENSQDPWYTVFESEQPKEDCIGAFLEFSSAIAEAEARAAATGRVHAVSMLGVTKYTADPSDAEG